MSRLLYYIFLKPLSYLPLSILYGFSNVIAFLLYYLIPYRKKVVMTNLQKSFPNKSEQALKRIARKFYQHLSDIIVEGIKLFSISNEEAVKRFKVKNPELLTSYYEKGIPVILVGAHYNNWELLATAIDQQIAHQAVGIYSKIENAFFSEKFLESRSKYGLKMIPTKEVAPYFIRGFEKPTVTIFGSDQSPTYNKGVIWTDFLNQDTAVANGTERFARKFNYPVIFGVINKERRGYYSLDFELLSESPKELAEEELTKMYTRRIEEQIIAEPAYWLWTHKRWKRKR